MKASKKNIAPPRVADKLLHAFLRDDLAEEVQGDLEEKFYSNLKTKSALKSKLNYWYQVLNYMRLFALRKSKKPNLNQYDMLQNYLKIGFRNLAKSKLFSAINISGMAISIASFLIIALFINDELQFDKHIEDVNLKYRVYSNLLNEDGSTRIGAMVPPPIGPTLTADFAEVESYTRFLSFNNPILFKAGEKVFTEGKGGYADPTVFSMFSMKIMEGDQTTALKEPNTIALSQTLKLKYFGDKPCLGEVIEIFNRPFKVVAVFEDFQSHAHFQRNFFLAMEGYIQQSDRMQNWGWSQFHTYIKLKPGTDAVQLETKFKNFVERHAGDEGDYSLHLMPMEKVHLHASDQLWDVAVRGNIQTVYILSATAAFILIIAILNFVNLSTARAINRIKEVGVRKIAGAFRIQLIYQFISESVIIASIALVIGGLAARLALPGLNLFTEKSIPTGIFLNPMFVLSLLLFAIIIGFAAGAYPAFYISSYKPIHILANRQSGSSQKNFFRKGLVVLQFVLSFFLIVASLIVSEQYIYMRSAKMGFDKDNLIVLRLRGEMRSNLETTKQSFSNHTNILNATLGYGLPGEAFAGDGIQDKRNNNKELHCNMLTVDHDYIKTLGLEVIAGRDFSKDILSDEGEAFIVTEAAAKMLGHTNYENILGYELSWPRWDAPDSLKEGKVIGVVKDIQLNSMREAINPIVLHVFPFAYSSITMRIKPDDFGSTVAHLEKTWKSFNTVWPFEYKFLDENFDKMYKSEEKLSVLFTWFTGFTIFVACLGLFGLVVYSTSQKYKEISIRKVLGAGESNLVVQLSKSYVLLISIAFIIAIPLSYFAASEWLQKFAFRISITPLLFIKAALLIAGLSLLTVGLQSFKAARTNPVDALKEQ